MQCTSGVAINRGEHCAWYCRKDGFALVCIDGINNDLASGFGCDLLYWERHWAYVLQNRPIQISSLAFVDVWWTARDYIGYLVFADAEDTAIVLPNVQLVSQRGTIVVLRDVAYVLNSAFRNCACKL